MRLIFTTLLAVILSAVFCDATAKDPQDAGGEMPQVGQRISKQPLKTPEKYSISFKDFKAKYGKKYASEAEQKYRLHVFYANLRIMNKHNKDPQRSFNMRPNSFLDLENAEFKDVYTKTFRSDRRSWNISNQIIRKHKEKSKGSANKSASREDDQQELPSPVHVDQFKAEVYTNISSRQPEENSFNPRLLLQGNDKLKSTQLVDIDWTIFSGKVKFQGICGACYAFSAVDTLAAHNSIKKFGFFVPLSIQQVIDCSANDLTYGCRGGYLEGAYTYIQMNGVVLESSYPYTYMNTSIAGSCKSKGGPFKLSSFTPIQGGNCNALIDELAHGPISVGVSGYNLQYYGEGVFNECSNDLDHAVMVVGYRSGVGWRIKNSWGADWGEEGYGWIAEGNTCGICDMAVSIKL